MADGDQNNSAQIDEKSDPSTHNDANEELETTDKSGWLLKRTKISHKWIKQWFHLKKLDMFYGDSEQNMPKKISLDGAQISETDIDGKQFSFSIKQKDSSRVYYICAETEDIQNSWMEAICFAKAAHRTGDKSEACVLQ
ncbi:unnamed protein product [Owenia fusiformis]|uniref:Uncharacterized protein n=1 Tax=Owenia fusiformis TaxID=6347 RepID=A0A8J1U2V8_OWEFU|nr:unnamed protein product [Owenia fusiformis]